MEENETSQTGKWRYIFAGVLIFAAFAVCVYRLADWQIVNGASFLEKANHTSEFTISMDAARGEILDANGSGLAVNKTGYAIVFDKIYMTSGTENKTIIQLINLLGKRGEKWVDVLPITVNSSGKYEFIKGEEKEITRLKSKDYLNMEPYATADQCMQHLAENYDCKGYSAKDTRDIVSVRYNMTKSWFSISYPYTFADDVSKETISIINENSAKLPGATAKVTTVRQCPDGTLLPHILGTVGAISQEEYEKLHVSKDYALDARIGKSGIEQVFEDKLRGTVGEKVVELTNSGSVESETVTKAPSSGNTVYLTIDSNLQKVLNTSLTQNVQGAQAWGRKLCAENYKGSSKNHGEDCTAGAAVVLRVKDLAVLAASTYPSYDLNEYLKNSNYYTSLLKDGSKPLINRALNGNFTPGSIVKPYVALAALQENAITTSTRILGNSKYMRFASSNFTPGSIGNYGMITLNKAIEKSSNSFFYEVGYRLGITKMNLYAKRFGLGVKTGIELSESAGTLAGPAEVAAAGGSWWDGDTVEAAVGQSDNKFTPLQLATYVSTIANNGTRLTPHIVEKVTDYSRKKTIFSAASTVADKADLSQQNLNYVKAAMHSVATSGTASSMFANYGIAIAAKTGTAERDTGSDNVTFVAFAPYENPEIAIAVVLDHGATSKFSNQVAKDIFDAYFFGKTVDKSGNLVIPSASSAASSSSSGASSSAGQ